MRGAAAGRFFVGVRSGGSAVPGKEGRSAAAGQRSARTSENEKSFSASPSLPTVWNSHQTGTRSAIASRSPSGSRSRRRQTITEAVSRHSISPKGNVSEPEK